MILLILIGLFLVYWITGEGSGGYFTGIDELMDNILITIVITILALVIGRYENKYSWGKSIGCFVLPMLLITVLTFPIIEGDNISYWYNRYKLNQVQKQFSIQLLKRTNLMDSESYSFTQYFLTRDKKFIVFRKGDNIVVKSRNNEIIDSYSLTEDVVIYLNQTKYYKPKCSLALKTFDTFMDDYIKIGDKKFQISEEGKFIPIK